MRKHNKGPSSDGKASARNVGDPSLGREDPLEKELAIHSSTLAWKVPWTEEPGRLQSMGLQRIRHDWATSLSKWPFGGKAPALIFVQLDSHNNIYNITMLYTHVFYSFHSVLMKSLAVNNIIPLFYKRTLSIKDWSLSLRIQVWQDAVHMEIYKRVRRQKYSSKWREGSSKLT